MRRSLWGHALAFAIAGCVSNDGPAGLPPPSVQEAAEAEAPASGFGTAIVDGVIGDEWAGAVTFPLHDYAGQPVEGTRFLIMNDMDNLYVGLTVTEQPGEDLLDVRFDNDADGVLDEDEDELMVRGPGIVTDQRLIDANATVGDYCCWGYGDAQQDGGAAVGVSEQAVSYEAWHPLNSGDGQDFAVRGGAVIGVCALYYDAPVFVLRQTPSRCGFGGMDLSGFLQYRVSQPTVEEVVDQLIASIGGLVAASAIPPPAGLGLLPIATAAQGRLAAGHAVACRSLLNAFIARLEMAAAAGQLGAAEAAELRRLAVLALQLLG